MPDLHCSTSKHGGLIVVAAVGDVDLASADTLWDELGTQVVPDSMVALDCTGITFIDSMGLQALMRAHQSAADQNASFALIGANEYVNRVLELAGLVGVIPQFPDADAAGAALGADTDQIG